MVPSILILYHFFFPDDVASASHMYQFAQELVQRGWNVTVLTTNRFCREPLRSIPVHEETIKGVRIIRLSRPAWNQASSFHRVLNSVWVSAGWLLKLLRLKPFDVILVGSDPAFAPVFLPFARLFKKATLLVHWCFDLYPEIIVADGDVRISTKMVALLKWLMQKSYRSSHLIADLGACMRQRLAAYDHGAQQVTLVPWALVEPSNITPPNPEIRKKMFGDASLGLLYSGTLGRAHDYDLFLKFARLLRQKSPNMHICFSCRGNKADELRNAVTSEDTNISFMNFVEEHLLEDHLNAADIHLISLKKDWSGLVIPSKFFGSLALGKPVIYAGPEDSAIAEWITNHKIGFHLTEESLEETAMKLEILACNISSMNTLRKRAFSTYHTCFSKKIIVDQWDHLIRALLAKHDKMSG